MNHRQRVLGFQPQNVHVDPPLRATLKRSFSLPDLDQPATFLLLQCCNPLLVSLTCEQPALSPARHPLYEDVHQIRNAQLRTVKSVRMSDTSQMRTISHSTHKQFKSARLEAGTRYQLGQAFECYAEMGNGQ